MDAGQRQTAVLPSTADVTPKLFCSYDSAVKFGLRYYMKNGQFIWVSDMEKAASSGQAHTAAQPRSAVRGRPFEKGNGGRKPGSKNKTTQIAEALLKGEEEELVRKGIELAKAGDPQMLKFFLDRILPKDRTVRIDLPAMERADNAVDALGAIVNAIGDGRITLNEGAAMSSLVFDYARAIKIHEHEFRLDRIERETGR
jgi:hypothetical protein